MGSLGLGHQLIDPVHIVVQLVLLHLGRLFALHAFEFHVSPFEFGLGHGLARVEAERVCDVERIGLDGDAIQVVGLAVEVS